MSHAARFVPCVRNWNCHTLKEAIGSSEFAAGFGPNRLSSVPPQLPRLVGRNDTTGVPLCLEQKLMRHAHIPVQHGPPRTASMETKRKAKWASHPALVVEKALARFNESETVRQFPVSSDGFGRRYYFNY